MYMVYPDCMGVPPSHQETCQVSSHTASYHRNATHHTTLRALRALHALHTLHTITASANCVHR